MVDVDMCAGTCLGMSRGREFWQGISRGREFRLLRRAGRQLRTTKYILLANTHKRYLQNLPLHSSSCHGMQSIDQKCSESNRLPENEDSKLKKRKKNFQVAR